jgi:hypothetical protein
MKTETLNIVSKTRPLTFRKVPVTQVRGTLEWEQLLRCDEFTTADGEKISRKGWGW